VRIRQPFDASPARDSTYSPERARWFDFLNVKRHGNLIWA
jgi:hypothetical protein